MKCGSHFSPARFPKSDGDDIAAYFEHAKAMGGPVVLTEQMSEPFSDLFIRQVQNGAKMAGLPFHLYFSPIQQDDRTKVDYPVSADCVQFCAAYRMRLSELADLRPDLLGLCTEYNLAKPSNTYHQMAALMAESRWELKRLYPDLETTVSLQYDVMRRSGDFSAINEVSSLCDVFTFTTYPWAFGYPPSKDYYAGLRLYGNWSRGISEIGISSAGVCGEWKQLRRYREAWVGLQDAGCEFVTLMQMHDLPAMHDNPQLTCLGVRRADGTPKAAWRCWQ